MDLSGLSAATTSVSALSGLVIVSPQNTIGYQPQNAPSWQKSTSVAQPPALLFNYEGEQKVQLTADITDHYVEDNTAVQDQIAIKPTIITTHGFVGELNDIFPGYPVTLQTLESKLVVLSAYTPALTLTAIIALQTAQQLYQVAVNAATSAVSAIASINGTGQQAIINGSGITNPSSGSLTQTQQQKYFTQFYGYFIQRTLFTVQTPWAVFQDMAIQSLTSIQDETSVSYTDFEITFKQMRFASALVDDSAYDPNGFDGRLGEQGSSPVNGGVNALTPSSTPFSPQNFTPAQ